MMYYIVFPDIAPNYTENHLLGEKSYNNFWTGIAWLTLNKINQSKPHLMEKLSVKRSDNKDLTMLEFLEEIGSLKIVQ